MACADQPTRRTLIQRDILRLRLALDFMSGATLTAQDIIGRYYSGVSPSSFHKTFKRDRDALAAEGVYLIESTHGTSKAWRLDRQRSCAQPDRQVDRLAQICALMLTPLLEDPEQPSRHELAHALARLGRTLGAGGGRSLQHGSCNEEVLSAVSKALANRQPCDIVYKSKADARPKTRHVLPYGVFMLGEDVYLVCLRSVKGKPDALRTLNLARATRATLAGAPGSYSIPADFSIGDHRLLPFEIGDEDPQEVRLFAPTTRAAHLRDEVGARGAVIESERGGVEWTGTSRNLRLTASWCVKAGAIPLAPQGLVYLWTTCLEEVARA